MLSLPVLSLPKGRSTNRHVEPIYEIASNYLVLKSEGEPESTGLQDNADCDLSLSSATPYDGTFLLGEALTQCGDRDTACIRDFFYATQY